MAINLQKGQGINLDKNQFDLSEITIGLGWDVIEDKSSQQKEIKKESIGLRIKGLLGIGKASAQNKHLYAVKRNNPVFRQEETKPYDLDAIAFLLDENNKILNLGNRSPLENGQVVDFVGGDIIFYNNPKHHQGAVSHTGDNRTGEGEGDDEQIVVKLNQLNPVYKKIVFIACIYQGIRKGQHFGLIENAFVRAIDASGKEIVKYNLSKDKIFENKRTIVFAEVVRSAASPNQWRFQAVGDALETDRFGEVLTNYLS
jgi:tellurium resistance protein TerD